MPEKSKDGFEVVPGPRIETTSVDIAWNVRNYEISVEVEDGIEFVNVLIPYEGESHVFPELRIKCPHCGGLASILAIRHGEYGTCDGCKKRFEATLVLKVREAKERE